MTEHTPAPWDVEDPMEDSLWIVPGGKQTYEWWPIAVCSMPDEDDHLFTSAEVRANAALIARAPDLLAENTRLLTLLKDITQGQVIVGGSSRDAEVTRLREVNAGLVGALENVRDKCSDVWIVDLIDAALRAAEDGA